MPTPSAPTHATARDAIPQVGDKTCTASRHGSSTAYREGCRCPAARAAMARAARRRVKRRYLVRGPLLVRAIGTHRRLQALQASGWPRRTLAARLGYTSQCLPPLLYDVIHIDTATRVRALYEELADVAGPSNSARLRAQAKGWLPPLAWDDDTIDDPAVRPEKFFHRIKSQHSTNEFINSCPQTVDSVAVERYLAGEREIPLNRAEKHAAYQQLRHAGHTVTAAARILHLSGSAARRLEQAISVLDDADTALDTYVEETG